MSTALLNSGFSFGLIFFCLLLSAFFSASETAITALGTLKVKHLLNKSGGKSFSYMKLWLRHPGRVLTTILIFNNVVNILASSVATHLAYQYYESGAIGVATGVITSLVLVFGEIIPKSFAKAYSEKIALFSMRVIVVIYFVTYPLVRALSGLADLFIKFVSKGRMIDPLITEEEIEFMVSEGEKAGVIQEIKKDIIEGAFDFDETKVREIMTPRTDIIAFASETQFADIIKVVNNTGHSRFPVYKKNIDQIVGIILAKDLLRIKTSSTDFNNLYAKELMREALFAPESKSIMEVFKDLKKSKSHMAVIIDEYGGTAGVVTMEDILEEFVGEIQDEFDSEIPKIKKIDKNIFEVSGSINIEEFFDRLKLEKVNLAEFLPDQEVDTLAGWVTQIAGQMPKKGQKVSLGPIQLEVINVSRHRINLVRVERIESNQQPGETDEDPIA